MKKTTLFTAVTFMVLFGFNTHAQLGITSYSLYALGVNTSQSKKISGELKTFANRAVDDLLMEADLFYNFKPRPYHRFSIGVGVNVAPFRSFDQLNAITLPTQLEVFPLQNFKKLSLLYELTPEYTFENDLNLRHLWGVRYTFDALPE